MTTGGLAISLRAGEPARLVSRRKPAAAVFEGRRPHEVLGLASLLFTVCGEAQAACSAMALEAATGVVADGGTEALRRRRIAVEALREHLFRILADWPAAAGEAPATDALGTSARLSRSALARPDSAGGPFAAFAAGIVFGEDAACPDSLDGLLAWAEAGRTGAARLIQRVVAEGWSASGGTEGRFLPDFDEEAAWTAIAETPAGEPVFDGGPCETTPLARTHDAGLVAAIAAAHGRGLLARLAARLVEVDRLAAEIAADLAVPVSATPASPPTTMPEGAGAAMVETARGRLIHMAEVTDGRVRRYRILAPTDWNFHMHGPASEGLTAMACDGRADLERRARLLVEAFDPCVAYSLKVH